MPDTDTDTDTDTFIFPEIVHNNYMGIYKMNHRITLCINRDMVVCRNKQFSIPYFKSI